MSGAFYYPRPADSVLQFYCYEGGGGPGYSYTYDIDQNGTYSIPLPVLEQDVKDWGLPVGCGMKLYEFGEDGGITGAAVTVTSETDQPASIFAMSSTVTYERITSSTTATPSPAPNFVSTTSSMSPMATSTSPIITVDRPNRGGLSTGAKAGIGAGISVGAFLVAAAAYLLYRNHRKMEDFNARLTYQSQAEMYKPVGVAVAHQEGNGINI
ncbi:uncharacterized protein ALTATR162_LOCUS6990 [Alternaria atra]|uniref:Mid2 domain-containing protein n=1 Tax=Alternaria atra TaxID=119953 RepID=A0A8J2I4A9_9PLEO|nr:uncharacterized protein ALTATR162_LOCUS6990 [Alternaria atra]CAG5166874.1 unnamed protein product [Alternaria atra]